MLSGRQEAISLKQKTIIMATADVRARLLISATHETVDRCLKNTVGRRIAVQITVHQLTPREVLWKALSKNEPPNTSKDVANMTANST